jgi:CRP-like cAMP-binding protein
MMDVERLRRLPLFGELDHFDLSRLSHWVKEVDIASGDLVIEQGAIPHDLFVIETGTVEVEHDEKVVATLGPGDVVGEMGLLELRRRVASVRATSQVHAVTLGADELAAMTDQMPELVEKLREIVARRHAISGL